MPDGGVVAAGPLASPLGCAMQLLCPLILSLP